MKLKILITFLLIGLFYSSHAFDNERLYPKTWEYKGIKRISESTFDKWKVICFFDKEGFLLQETNYYKKEMRSDYNYEYIITDTLLELKKVDNVNVNNTPPKIEQYYHDSLGKCYKIRMYSGESVTPYYYEDNFVYENGMLISYTQGKMGGIKFICKYNEKKQKVQIQKTGTTNYKDTTFYSYVYNQSGQLTDYIQESSDNEAIYDGVPSWSNKKMNKIHIRYSNFDKRGNWTKSYFITEKGKVLRSERKIEYW